MSTLTLEIGRVVVETQAEQLQLQGVSTVIAEAFRLLAEKLDRTPFRQFGEGRTIALDELSLSPLPLDELLSARGAERLADELYDQILRRQP